MGEQGGAGIVGSDVARPDSRTRARRLAVALALVAGLSCSSGSSGGGGSKDQVTAIARGPITSIGSVTVTGTRWDTDGAEICFDGREDPETGEPCHGGTLGSADDLAVGMVALVQGRRRGGRDEGRALRVDVETSVVGPIESVVDVDELFAELSVVGRTVRVDREETRFGGVPTDYDFDAMAVGDLVHVWGPVDAEETIAATRIERRGALGEDPSVRLGGTATDWMPAGDGGSFRVGEVTVVYADDDLLGLSASELGDEPFVTVGGDLTGVDAVDATAVELRSPFEGDFRDLQIEGIVSEYLDLDARFRVGGQPAEAIFFVALEPEDLEDVLRDGLRVEVEGPLVDGVLSVEAMRLREPEARVGGELAEAGDVDLEAATIRLLGVTVELDEETRLLDETDPPAVPLTLGDLAPGDHLVARGVDVEGVVRATSLRRTDPGDATLRGRVRGFVSPPVDQGFDLLGVTVGTDGATSFLDFPADVGDESGFYTFLFANPRSLVAATGSDDPRFLDLADTVELED